MFGFSLPKLLVLIGIIALVWYGFKIFGRGRELGKPKNKDDESGSSVEQNVEMERCSICKDFVDSGALSCGKDDCPFPIV